MIGGLQNFRWAARALLICLIVSGAKLGFAQEATAPLSVNELQQTAGLALRTGDNEKALSAANQLFARASKQSVLYRVAGDVLLRAGDSAKAVKAFDEYLKSHGEERPYLWQRGIALYFVGDFAEGAKQFEEHRLVNPNDVENAAWHFLCVAKAESFAASKKQVLPAPGDRREPMDEVLDMLKTGDTQRVRDRMSEIPEGTSARASADFYGLFYLGLYADAKGETDEARKLLSECAEDAPRNYMGDVARVYAEHLKKAAPAE